MANTKKLTRDKRKQAKRRTRRRTKATWAGLTRDQRRAFLKGDEKSLKKYVATIQPKEEPKPKEEAPAPEAPAEPSAQ